MLYIRNFKNRNSNKWVECNSYKRKDWLFSKPLVHVQCQHFCMYACSIGVRINGPGFRKCPAFRSPAHSHSPLGPCRMDQLSGTLSSVHRLVRAPPYLVVSSFDQWSSRGLFFSPPLPIPVYWFILMDSPSLWPNSKAVDQC